MGWIDEVWIVWSRKGVFGCGTEPFHSILFLLAFDWKGSKWSDSMKKHIPSKPPDLSAPFLSWSGALISSSPHAWVVPKVSPAPLCAIFGSPGRRPKSFRRLSAKVPDPSIPALLRDGAIFFGSRCWLLRQVRTEASAPPTDAQATRGGPAL
jgi:hypothetical protein